VSVATAGLILALIGGGASAAVAIVSARFRQAHGDPADDGVTHRRVEVGLVDAMRALMTGLLLSLVALVIGRPLLHLDLFGMIHIGYLFVVVAAPVAAAAMLASAAVLDRWSRRPPLAPPWRVTRPVMAFLVPMLLLAPLGVYMTHIEPYWLSVDHVGPVTIATERAGGEPIRIGVLTDWQLRHVGDYEISAVDELLAADPDIILLPGDIFQDDDAAFERELPALRAQFNRMQVRGGAFLVDGDSDPVSRLRRLTEGTPVRLLENEIVQVQVADRVITIGGSELDYTTGAAMQVADDLEVLPGTDDIRILVSHRPDAIFNLPAQPRTDLVVAGHTHGGQIALPGFGPLMTLSDVPRHIAGGGLFVTDGKQIYVGRGVGVERNQAPQMRLFVRPNIGILTMSG